MASTNDPLQAHLKLVPTEPRSLAESLAPEGAQLVSLTQRLAEVTRQLALTRSLLADKQRECQQLICSVGGPAPTDELTGLPSRRRFYEQFNAEIARSERYRTPLALIMVDIDHFRRVNDLRGHLMGDRVLVEISKVLAARTRAQDLLCRWDGEEFAILAPHLDLRGALQMAEKLRSAVEQADHGVVGTVTCSFGVALLEPEEEPIDLLLRADLGVYRAKRAGRNRVATPDDGEAPVVPGAAAS